MSLIAEIKAKHQQLVKQYNQLQAEATQANTPEESIYKIAESEKIFQQIKELRKKIAQLDPPHAKPKPKSSEPADNKHSNEDNKSSPEPSKTRLSVEDRIHLIENSQQKTKEQLKKFSKVKQQLVHLKEEAEQHAISVAQQSSLYHQQLQKQVESLNEQLLQKEARYEVLKQEFNMTRYEDEKTINSLKQQLETTLEKQKSLEKSRNRAFRLRGGGNRFSYGLLLGLSLSLITVTAFLVILLKTTWLDNTVYTLKSKPASHNMSSQ